LQRWYPRTEAEDESVEWFYKIMIAYQVLKDPERTRIYDATGIAGLFEAENLNESSIFDYCPWTMYDAFFAGVEKEDRDYLLFNGPNHLSDDEASSWEDEEDDDDDAESSPRKKHIVFSDTESGDEGPPGLGFEDKVGKDEDEDQEEDEDNEQGVQAEREDRFAGKAWQEESREEEDGEDADDEDDDDDEDEEEDDDDDADDDDEGEEVDDDDDDDEGEIDEEVKADQTKLQQKRRVIPVGVPLPTPPAALKALGLPGIGDGETARHRSDPWRETLKALQSSIPTMLHETPETEKVETLPVMPTMPTMPMMPMKVVKEAAKLMKGSQKGAEVAQGVEVAQGAEVADNETEKATKRGAISGKGLPKRTANSGPRTTTIVVKRRRRGTDKAGSGEM
jgi:hypothetical protein